MGVPMEVEALHDERSLVLEARHLACGRGETVGPRQAHAERAAPVRCPDREAQVRIVEAIRRRRFASRRMLHRGIAGVQPASSTSVAGSITEPFGGLRRRARGWAMRPCHFRDRRGRSGARMVRGIARRQGATREGRVITLDDCINLDDLRKINDYGRGRIDVTVGSALDIFGGSGMTYKEAVDFCRQ